MPISSPQWMTVAECCRRHSVHSTCMAVALQLCCVMVRLRAHAGTCRVLVRGHCWCSAVAMASRLVLYCMLRNMHAALPYASMVSQDTLRHFGQPVAGACACAVRHHTAPCSQLWVLVALLLSCVLIISTHLEAAALVTSVSSALFCATYGRAILVVPHIPSGWGCSVCWSFSLSVLASESLWLHVVGQTLAQREWKLLAWGVLYSAPSSSAHTYGGTFNAWQAAGLARSTRVDAYVPSSFSGWVQDFTLWLGTVGSAG